MRSVTAQGERSRVNCLYRTERITLDARNLHESTDWIARHPKVMFDADFCCVFYLVVAATERSSKSSGGHRTGNTGLALAADFGTGNRRVHLTEGADRRRRCRNWRTPSFEAPGQ